MTNIIKILRSATFGNRPAVGTQQYGVPYVNLADKQIGVVDSTQIPQDLVGVPFFSASANYNTGQPVNYLGQLYVALVNVTAGAWNPAQWSLVARPQYSDMRPYPILSINGAMSVSQELGTTGANTIRAATYILDQFMVGASGAGALSAAQQACSPALPGFSWQLGVGTAVAAASLAPTDYAVIMQFIEGARIARLAWGTANAQPITIGFYLYSSVSGSIALAVRNGANNRNYIANVTITAVSSWQWYTVTIPGDVAGTWTIDTTLGMQIAWTLACGTGNQGAAGVWQAGGLLGTSSTMNLLSVVNRTVQLTGVIVVPGATLPPPGVVPFVLPTYDQELAACQRYWQKYPYWRWDTYAGAAGAYVSWTLTFSPMRIAPPVGVSGTTATNCSGLAAQGQGTTNANLFVQATAAGAVGLTTAVTLNARM